MAAEVAAGRRDRVFEALLRAHLDFAFSVATEYAITFMAPRPASPDGAPGRPAVGLHAFRRFREQLAALMAEGILRPVTRTPWRRRRGRRC